MARSHLASLAVAALSLAQAALSVPGCARIKGDADARRGSAQLAHAAAGPQLLIAAAETPKPPITLDGGDAEVWTWKKTLTGTCSCGDDRAVVRLRVNDAEIAAERQGERFSAVVPLDEGENRIVAYCRTSDGAEHTSEPITLSQRLHSRPTARIRISLKPDAITLDGRRTTPSEATGASIRSYQWLPRRDNPAPLLPQDAAGSLTGGEILLAPPQDDGEYYISLKVTDVQGATDTATTYFVVENGKPRLPDWATENPAWVERAIIYGVVPHNFGFHGFRSVTQRLDSLQDLGVTALWLSPSNTTPSRGHGYEVTDYFNLRPDYGTKADFRELIKEAHARGIRVLMDFVPNHSSIFHRYMRHAQQHGKASPYYDFYDRDEHTGDYTHYFHWQHLPNLNYDNPEVRRWILEAFSYWVREFDVDGFRVDVAWGVKLRRPDFWIEWRKELKRIKPDLLLLAEASAREPWWFTNGFDAAYDWTYEPGRWSLENVFDEPNQTVPRLREALTNSGRGFDQDALVFRFLNNNDTGHRFITRHGVATEMVAAAMLLTLPGLPCIYTGQEVGAEFHPYRMGRPIPWDDWYNVRDYYKKLIWLRRNHPTLHSRQWEILKVEPEQHVLAYARYGGPQDAPVLVALNFSQEPTKAQVTLTRRSASLARTSDALDLLLNERVHMQRRGQSAVQVPIPSLGVRILAAPQS